MTGCDAARRRPWLADVFETPGNIFACCAISGRVGDSAEDSASVEGVLVLFLRCDIVPVRGDSLISVVWLLFEVDASDFTLNVDPPRGRVTAGEWLRGGEADNWEEGGLGTRGVVA